MGQFCFGTSWYFPTTSHMGQLFISTKVDNSINDYDQKNLNRKLIISHRSQSDLHKTCHNVSR